MKKKILYIINSPDFFLSHRLPVALKAISDGYDVHVASANGSAIEVIKKHGMSHHLIPLSRSGQNPFLEIFLILKIYFLLLSIKPYLVHLVTIKPVLYGAVAARLAGVKRIVAAVSGLGTVFVAASSMAKLRRFLIISFYKLALRSRSVIVIFQNSSDKGLLLYHGVIDESQCRLIKGSGVSLEDCPFYEEPIGNIVITFAARLLKEKGVVEFVEAAKIIKEKKPFIEFRIIGSPDPGNPSSVTFAEIEEWQSKSIINYLGYRTDVPSQYSLSHIVCLPSYYGEGLPKSLVEAAACGRPVITTDMPGCRDAILPGVTGILVKPRDTNSLVEAIVKLVDDTDLRIQFGKAGREFAEKEFSIDKIVKEHMAIYHSLDSNDDS